MPQKNIYVPGVGDVLIVRRRKSRSMRLNITPSGGVRVSQPYWAPYATGISFVKRKVAWINKQCDLYKPLLLEDEMRIGKLHTLYLRNSPNKTSIKLTDTDIVVPYSADMEQSEVQDKALVACEKALKIEAENILPQQLQQIADKHGFSYKNVRIRKLTARWGSCSAHKIITLNYFLVQLPWHLIDYVLIHELIHTEHLHHGRDFWQEFLKIEPKARQYQKDIRQYKPRVEPLP